MASGSGAGQEVDSAPGASALSEGSDPNSSAPEGLGQRTGGRARRPRGNRELTGLSQGECCNTLCAFVGLGRSQRCDTLFTSVQLRVIADKRLHTTLVLRKNAYPVSPLQCTERHAHN